MEAGLFRSDDLHRLGASHARSPRQMAHANCQALSGPSWTAPATKGRATNEKPERCSGNKGRPCERHSPSAPEVQGNRRKAEVGVERKGGEKQERGAVCCSRVDLLERLNLRREDL